MRALLVGIPALLLAWAAPARADGLLAAIEETLTEPVRLVAEWENNNLLAFGMVAMVFLLGAVIAIIHSVPKPNVAKLGAVVLGSAVTLLTALSNAYFDFDHRQYKSMASQGRQLLSEIKATRLQLREIPPENRQAREALYEEIRRHRNAIMAIPSSFKPRDKAVLEAPVRTGGVLGTAHAVQVGGPEWVSRLPVDDENLYFVGYADGADYAGVKRASEERAYADARNFVGARLGGPAAGGVDATGAAQYLLDSSRIVGNYSFYDKKLNTFRYYTLLALSRKTAESDLRLYGGKTSRQATPSQQVALQQAARSSSDYLSNRLAIYSRELDKAQAQLSAAELDQFSRARKLRHDGRARDAVAALQAFTRVRPDFYLGWFNLALALDEVNEVAAARAAYERAIDLEKKATVRDASLYNTYGYFLYRQQDYPLAVTHLKAALAIAPDHPNARATLKAAQAAATGARGAEPVQAPAACDARLGFC